MINYLEYKGEKIPYRISYFALSRWSSETGKTTDELDEIDTNMTLLEPLIWFAIVAGCKAEGMENPLNREDFPFIMDDIFEQFVEGMGDFSQGTAEAQNKKNAKAMERKNLTKGKIKAKG
jgi:hypothetical protein